MKSLEIPIEKLFMHFKGMVIKGSDFAVLDNSGR
jgi:hypothetical protein